MGRFDGPPHPQGPVRFDGPIGQQPPVRFEGQGLGHFEGPMQRFSNMAPGPGSGPVGFQQQRPMRFEGPPNQMGPIRFEGPGPMHFDGPMQPGPRFDGPHQGGTLLYDSAPGQQGQMRFTPQHNLQPPMRPMAPPMYENSMGPQQNFNMAPQRFPEPINPQFPAGPMAFPAQPNLQQAGNFSIQPAPPFNQQGSAPFYSTASPAVGLQQPVSDAPIVSRRLSMSVVILMFSGCSQVNMLGNLNQPFLPQNAPFGQQSKPRPLRSFITAPGDRTLVTVCLLCPCSSAGRPPGEPLRSGGRQRPVVQTHLHRHHQAVAARRRRPRRRRRSVSVCLCQVLTEAFHVMTSHGLKKRLQKRVRRLRLLPPWWRTRTRRSQRWRRKTSPTSPASPLTT